MPCTVIDTLQELVRINSVNPAYDEGQPEAAIASFIARFCEERGIDVWEQEVLPGRPNLIARISGEQPDKRIVFEAHVDTVATTGMKNPFVPVIRKGRLYGRGACDNKGGLAAMMHGLDRVQRSGQKPPCEIWLAASADEEHSSQGVKALCKSLQAEAAVVAEPTELRMAIASKGCVRWRIVAHGRAAHSSKPHLGNNAIVHMAHIIREIEKDSQSLSTHIHPLVGSPTCNIGLIQGGTQVNMVPESCTLEIERRLLPGEEVAEVLAHYDAMLADLHTAMPMLSYTMEPPTIMASPLETPISSPVARRSAEVLYSMGLNSEPIGVAFSCDASALSKHGVPCVVFGPGSIDQAHTSEESVECAQVEQAVEFYRQMMVSNLMVSA